MQIIEHTEITRYIQDWLLQSTKKQNRKKHSCDDVWSAKILSTLKQLN